MNRHQEIKKAVLESLEDLPIELVMEDWTWLSQPNQIKVFEYGTIKYAFGNHNPTVARA